MSLGMDERLKKIAEDGDVDGLYSVLAQDPYVLDRIDQMLVVDTPLHVAASAGKTHIAVEIATLKPSFARKLNPLGFSPLHLDVQNGPEKTVRAMVKVDSELARVNAKGRVTLLHYVAQTENVNLFARLLWVCPSSIMDLTAQSETAVHVAVKNSRFTAFKLLLGCLLRANKEYILGWKDEDGNTVLHIATSTNQPEVMKLLIKHVDVNAKNFSDLTSIDISHLQRDSLNGEVGNILRRAKAKRSSEITKPPLTLAERLSRELSFIEKRDKYVGIDQIQDNETTPTDVLNIVLVVVTLIATATYQATLSPPGGFWQDDSPSKNNTTSNIGQAQKESHRAGELIVDSLASSYFFALNSIAFYSSVYTILFVVIGLPYSVRLHVSSCLLLYAYFQAMAIISPSGSAGTSLLTIFMCISTLMTLAVVWITWSKMLFTNNKELKAPVEKLIKRLRGRK